MLRGFILRRFVCGDSSRGYGQMFVRALARDAGDPVAALETYLLERGWPDDHRFVEAFVQFPLYKRGYACEVLETLEQARGHKEPAALQAAQIEHVMPQTLRHEWILMLGEDAERVHADWLHRPGNLTLSAYNQEVGNQPFEHKRARFAQSNIVLTREIGEAQAWDADAIRARGEAMAHAAKAIWAGPAEPYQAADDADDEAAVDGVPRQVLRRRFWNGFHAHMAQTHPEVPPFEPRQFKTIRLKSGVPHIGFELRHMLRPSEVAIDVYFWRTASFPVWERLQEDRAETDALIGDSWSFGRPDDDHQPRWMTVALAADSDDEDAWPSLYGWLGQKLALLYTGLAPLLRDEMREAAPQAAETQGASATKLQQQRFWGVVAEAMTERSTALRPQKPLPQHWTNYAIGRSGFALVPTVNSRDDRIGVELIIGTPNAKQQFQALLAQREAIDAALGFPVEWQELPDQVLSKIGCLREDSPPEDEARWDEYVAWMVNRLVRMDEVFRPLVRALP